MTYVVRIYDAPVNRVHVSDELTELDITAVVTDALAARVIVGDELP